MEIVDELPKILPKKISVDLIESEISNDEYINRFEVLETISNNDDTQNFSLIGLYETENEAIECCNIKQSMHDEAKKIHRINLFLFFIKFDQNKYNQKNKSKSL